MNVEKIKKIISSPATLSFLLLMQIILHLFYFKIQEFDLPNTTKKLVIDTIKNEISFNTKCVNENCKKEVRNLENVLTRFLMPISLEGLMQFLFCLLCLE